MKKAVLIILGFMLIGIFSIFYTRYTPVSFFDSDGYILIDNKITETIINDYNSSNEVTIKPKKIEEYDTIYEQFNKLFIGQNKKLAINDIYPFFTNDNLAIVNLSNNSKLIDIGLNYHDGYKNFTLTNGELYNKDDKIRADNYIYAFLQLENSLLINSLPFQLDTLMNTYNFSNNNIILFNENSIKYYYFENDKFILNEINDVDMNSILTFDKKKITYKDLLIFLGKIKPTSDIKEENTIIDIPEENKEIIEQVIPYQKPTVNCQEFKPSVYSILSTLKINDPSKVIKVYPTFEIIKLNEIYSRRIFSNSGNITISGLEPGTTYKIVGSYIYYNEDKKEIKNTFLEQIIQTKNLTELDKIELDFTNGNIYSNYIQINDLKIKNKISSETKNSIRRATIEIDKEIYKLSSKDLNSIINGDYITYNSPKKVTSNKKIEYSIKIYDSFGNELIIINSDGTTRTCKSIPTIEINPLENKIGNQAFNINLKNVDDIKIDNYRYVVIDNNNYSIVDENSINMKDKTINLNELDPNGKFTIFIYGDYDIENGQGVLRDQVIGERNFTSVSLLSLGKLILNLDYKKMSSDEINFDIKYDIQYTSPILVQILSSINYKIYKVNDTNKLLYRTGTMNNNELNDLKNNGKANFSLYDLDSFSEYIIEFEYVLTQANVDYSFNADTYNNNFKTIKKEPQITIKNLFAEGFLMDFDINIFDSDNAIENNDLTIVLMEANTSERVVFTETIQKKTNDTEYNRITINKVEPGKNYKIKIYGSKYNVTYNINDLKDYNYIYPQDAGKFITVKEGITGTISLNSLLEPKKETGNLFDIDSDHLWSNLGPGKEIFNINNNIISLGTTKGCKRYRYYLPSYIGDNITVSFDAEISSAGGTTPSPTYIIHGDNNSSCTTSINNNNKIKKGENSFSFSNFKGYVDFVINETSSSRITNLKIMNLMIEHGTNKSDFSKFINEGYIANINIDLKDESTTKYSKYFVRHYKNDVLEDLKEYNIDTQDSTYLRELEFPDIIPDATYRYELLIENDGRYYVLSSTEFTTESEIRGINSVEEFFKMQSHSRYVVLEDLNFSDTSNSKVTPYLTKQISNFYGMIDFNGKKITLKEKERGKISLISTIESTAIIKNLNLDVYINNTSPIYNYYGFVTYNRGTIENLMLTLKESTNMANYNITPFAYVNYGIINKFVVNAEVPFYGRYRLSYLVLENQKIIKNGYIYGENIILNDTAETNKNSGPLVAVTSRNSDISNVFSLSSVKVEDEDNYIVGNLIGNSVNGKLNNAYSVENDSIVPQRTDANYGYRTKLDLNNVYYFSNYIYPSGKSTKLSNVSLHDYIFHELLNDEKAFNIDALVYAGMYPQILFPNCMPSQSFIDLPLILEEEKVSVKSHTVESTTNAKFDENNVNVIKKQATATVTVNVYNPWQLKITDIKVVDKTNLTNKRNGNRVTYLNTVINSVIQSEENTVVNFTIATQNCYSDYYITSIVHGSGFNNNVNERIFENGEEYQISVDLFKEISSIAEWGKIKNDRSQNYVLTKDLDFDGISPERIAVYNTGSASDSVSSHPFTGILDGGNHTVSNIKIPAGTPVRHSGIIIYLQGTLKNLVVENYQIKKIGTYSGIVSYAIANTDTFAVIDNVHLIGENEMNGYNYIGGIVGYANKTQISNCSVTNLVITENKTRGADVSIGGIAGYIYENVLITNCFAQNVNLTENYKNRTYYSGIGGIAGYGYLSFIYNSYAIGNIDTKYLFSGGIIGIANTMTISGVYTDVDINSDYSSIGGIIGYTYDNCNIKNTLVLGSLYTTYTTSSIRRTVGNYKSAVLTNTGNNFAYENQMINGYIIPKDQDENNTEPLLTYNELTKENTYVYEIYLGNAFDYTKVRDGILPKLFNSNNEIYNCNKNGICNSKIIQADNYIEQVIEENDYLELDVKDITPSQVPNDLNLRSIFIDYDLIDLNYTGQELQNIRDIEFTGVEIDYLSIEKDSSEKDILNIISNPDEDTINEQSKTFKRNIKMQFIVSPKLYVDNYTLNKIYYSTNSDTCYSGTEYDKEKDSCYFKLHKKIVLDGDLMYYKKINSKIEWNKAQEVENRIPQNYILTSDIDFSGYTPVKNMGISRIKCQKNNNDSTPCKISNVNFVANSRSENSFINMVTNSISNVEFSNFEITVGSHYSSIISFNYGTLEQITFNNIKITVKNGNNYEYIAPIAINYGTVRLVNYHDVKIDGYNYVGGLIGTNSGSTNQIYGSKINVSGKNVYIGGFVGNQSSPGSSPYTYLIDAHVTGAGYVGGIAGDDGTNDSVILLSTVNNNYNSNYYGGIAGYTSYAIERATVINCKIKGYNNVGGIAGYSPGYSASLHVYNINDINELRSIILKYFSKTNSNKDLHLNSIINENNEKIYNAENYNNIINTADYTIDGNNCIGGLIGTHNSSLNRYTTSSSGVSNIRINGNAYVGGLIGVLQGRAYDNYNLFVDNVVIDSKSTTGGLIGQISSYNDSAAGLYKNVYVNATINITENEQSNSIGGLIGYYDNSITDDITSIVQFRNVLLANTNIIVNKQNGYVGGLIGRTAKELHINTETGVSHFKYIYLDVNTSSKIENNKINFNPVSGNYQYTSNSDLYNKEQIQNLYLYDKLKVNGNTLVNTNGYSLINGNQLRLENTYSLFINETTNWDIATNISRKDDDDNPAPLYPMIKTSLIPSASSLVYTATVNDQTKTINNLKYMSLPPAEGATASFAAPMLFRMRALSSVPQERIILPTFKVYTSASNKINLEFDDVYDNTTFSIISNNSEINNIKLDRKVYTFEYDFKTNFKVVVTRYNNSKTIEYKASDIKIGAITFNNKYYVLKKDKILTNAEPISGSYVNIFGIEGLDKNGNIHNFETSIVANNNTKGLTMINEMEPLFEFEYNNSKIQTFSDFSIITTNGEQTVVDMQLFVKNGKIEAIDNKLPSKKSSVIIDSYGENIYQTVLGTDGIIYNLKDSIKLPSDFINKKIKYMTNNIFDNSGIVVVEYTDNSFYGFDYRTGKKIFDTNISIDISLMDYIKDSLGMNKKIINANNKNSYDEGLSLMNKLKINPISSDNDKSNSTNKDSNSNSNYSKYLLIYDYSNGKYITFNEESLLEIDDPSEEKISENDKIYKNQELIDFYMGNAKGRNTMSNKHTTSIIVGIIITIFISLIAYYINLKYFKNKTKKV